jgi:hypothetical protein
MILPDLWSEDDAVTARNFFHSAAWKKAYQILMSPACRPSIDGKDKDMRYDQAIRREQHENTINMLTQFTISPEKQAEDHMPNLDMSTLTSKKFDGDIPFREELRRQQ